MSPGCLKHRCIPDCPGKQRCTARESSLLRGCPEAQVRAGGDGDAAQEHAVPGGAVGGAPTLRKARVTAARQRLPAQWLPHLQHPTNMR